MESEDVELKCSECGDLDIILTDEIEVEEWKAYQGYDCEHCGYSGLVIYKLVIESIN